MSRFPLNFRTAIFVAATALGLGAVVVGPVSGASETPSKFPGIGRTATEREVRAWDIDVRPDFKGLPAGSGSVAKGQDIWESKCASCHGVFGESNETFSPIVGGTTPADIQSGHVAKLTDPAYPQRTTLMKLSSLSTLWDYINRAMPWNQPKSLTTDEVYSVTAFILNLGGIIPDNFVLSDKNIADVQQKIPNRNGATLKHALWPGKSDWVKPVGTGTAIAQLKPDVQGSACRVNCAPDSRIASILPDHARGSHGNLAEQNRLVGAQRGAPSVNQSGNQSVDQSADPSAKPVVAELKVDGPANDSVGTKARGLLAKHACSGCHAVDAKLVGPSFQEVAKRYTGRNDAIDYLSGRIKTGGAGVWGAIPMPAQALPESDAKLISQWLAKGAAK